jgi:hypothetical protein
LPSLWYRVSLRSVVKPRDCPDKLGWLAARDLRRKGHPNNASPQGKGTTTTKQSQQRRRRYRVDAQQLERSYWEASPRPTMTDSQDFDQCIIDWLFTIQDSLPTDPSPPPDPSSKKDALEDISYKHPAKRLLSPPMTGSDGSPSKRPRPDPDATPRRTLPLRPALRSIQVHVTLMQESGFLIG